MDVVKPQSDRIAIKYVRPMGLTFSSRSWMMTAFGCGRTYGGWDDIVGPAIKRHELSGCKGCRRYKRRMVAILRAAHSQP